ncbi:MAG: hypothetical protein JSS96_15465 [Bacteroidetes bacterium]|nr:hypothetical protein [Bacteroidota bacterium]
MKILYLLVFAATLLIVSCKKDSKSLPSPTQNGNNIAACYLDGKATVFAGKMNSDDSNGVRVNNYVFKDGAKGLQVLLRNSSCMIEMYVRVEHPAYGVAYHLSYPESMIHAYSLNKSVDSSSSNIIFYRFDGAVAAGSFNCNWTDYTSTFMDVEDGFFDVKF